MDIKQLKLGNIVQIISLDEQPNPDNIGVIDDIERSKSLIHIRKYKRDGTQQKQIKHYKPEDIVQKITLHEVKDLLTDHSTKEIKSNLFHL